MTVKKLNNIEVNPYKEYFLKSSFVGSKGNYEIS